MTSLSSSRFGAFFSRVETEREVLSIINSCDSSHELHGLTTAAIDCWSASVVRTAPADFELVEEIARVLHRIAIRSDSHADQSRMVFADQVILTLPVHQLIGILQNLCVRWRQKKSSNQLL